MNNRDYIYYIELAKDKQGFKYDNQLNDALGFKANMISLIRKNKAHLSEEKMMELAELAGISDFVALMDHCIIRSNGKAKKAYEKILQKALGAIMILVAVGTFSTPTLAAEVLHDKCDSVYYGKLKETFY